MRGQPQKASRKLLQAATQQPWPLLHLHHVTCCCNYFVMYWSLPSVVQVLLQHKLMGHQAFK